MKRENSQQGRRKEEAATKGTGEAETSEPRAKVQLVPSIVHFCCSSVLSQPRLFRLLDGLSLACVIARGGACFAGGRHSRAADAALSAVDGGARERGCTVELSWQSDAQRGCDSCGAVVG